VLPVVAVLFGVVCALAGVALVAAYFLEAVVARLGEPDQSLLFWYLPILFLGLIGVVIGFTAGVWGIFRLPRMGGDIAVGDNLHLW
jgi:hypothetical protein